MKLLDIHCHVYPDNIARRAGRTVAAFYDRKPEDKADLVGTLDEALQVQSQAGICLSVLSSAATTCHQVRPINAFLARCVEKSGGRCLAFGTLHPDSDDLEGDIDHLLSLGIRGVKFHPELQKLPLNSSGMYLVMDALKGRLPVLLHTGDSRFPYSNPDQLMPLLQAFPGTRFIGTHMGGFTVWQEAWEKLPGRFPNLWVDLSSTAFFIGTEKLTAMVRAFGIERVLFGTDAPMLDPRVEVPRFLSMDLTEEERRCIAWDNGAELLGL